MQKPPTTPAADQSEPRAFREPVAWLLGPQMIGSLKNIIVHALYKGLDIRDWMHPTGPLDMATECGHTGTEPFWFDFLADTGDGQVQTYTIAYLCMAELAITEEALGARVSVIKKSRPLASGEIGLPRGSFLFVGGDTAYHVADHSTLETRFQKPFRWARADLITEGALGDSKDRPLIAIPGNHDYYDMLDGFNRQFRKPITERFTNEPSRSPALAVPGFRRIQEASYFAAELPHGWWLYGIDTEQDAIDFRQKTFFNSFRDDHGTTPKKLIVATPTPTTVFHRRPKSDEPLVESLSSIGLTLPFVSDGPDPLKQGECRIDISGDVHHYARYWGPKTGNTEAANDPSYASVVSGLGGAFHHPSTTVHGDHKPQTEYPKPDESKRAIARRLFRPWTIVQGGYARGVGAFIAALITGAFLVRGSSRWLVEGILERVTGVSFSSAQDFDGVVAFRAAYVFGALALLIGVLVVAVKWAGRIYQRTRDSSGTLAYWACFLMFYAAVAIMALALWGARRSPAGQIAFDVALYFFISLIVVGLIALAIKVGAAGRGIRVGSGFFGLGVWHLLMQLLPVPLLIKIGTPAAYGATLATWGVFLLVGWAVVRSSSRASPWIALFMWILFGVLLFAIPLWCHRESAPEPSGLTIAFYIGVAVLLGFVHVCIQFAWYLAISLGFNGHNNEVGGATRIGNYKQFIRFRVEKERITGYVIAVDEPKKVGAEIRAKLCDVFTLVPKAGP